MSEKKKSVKIYLLWDFEELCGVFSTLEKAMEAGRAQIGYHKKRHFADKRKGYHVGKIGNDFEGRDPPPRRFKKREWRRWSVGYETLHDDYPRETSVGIYEETLDKFESLLKRIYAHKRKGKRKVRS